jgi:hypothetical protein
VVRNAWTYHDYTSITAGVLSNLVAGVVLGPQVRPRILDRNRRLLQTNLQVLQSWLAGFAGHFHFVRPRAGGMAFMRYDFPINSTELSEWLRTDHGVFVLAGDTFGMDGYVRFGIGAATDILEEGLALVGAALRQRFG